MTIIQFGRTLIDLQKGNFSTITDNQRKPFILTTHISGNFLHIRNTTSGPLLIFYLKLSEEWSAVSELQIVPELRDIHYVGPLRPIARPSQLVCVVFSRSGPTDRREFPTLAAPSKMPKNEEVEVVYALYSYISFLKLKQFLAREDTYSN